MIARILTAVFGSLLFFACADDHMTSPASSSLRTGATGILQGVVTIGPNCPVESLDHPCLTLPSTFTSHKLVILNERGQQAIQVDIDGMGNYKTELMLGIYTVDFTPRDIGLPGSFQPPTAEIREGETTTLNIDIDTGIR